VPAKSRRCLRFRIFAVKTFRNRSQNGTLCGCRVFRRILCNSSFFITETYSGKAARVAEQEGGAQGNHTPKAGEQVDHHRLTQVGRAMRELGIQIFPAYSQKRDSGSEAFCIDALREFGLALGVSGGVRTCPSLLLRNQSKFTLRPRCDSNSSACRPGGAGLYSRGAQPGCRRRNAASFWRESERGWRDRVRELRSPSPVRVTSEPES
jgi:hypothetical protein